MRLLFFTHRLVGGGAEKTVVNLVEYINQSCEGYEAYIGVVYDDETVHQKLDCVYVLGSKTEPTMSKLSKIPIVLKQVKELKQLKKKLDVDVCISFLPGSDFLNVLSKGREKIILSVRNKESFFVNSIFRKWYIQFCYAKADKIVALSKGVESDITGYFGVSPSKVQTIYNPIPKRQNEEPVNDTFAKLTSGKRIVITAGRLTEQKGQKYLIRAFKLVADKISNAHLVILGEGELREDLESEIAALHLQDYVTLMGFVYNPMDYVKEADVFVFSSVVEGLGNVLMETLREGKTIISTDCDFGPREMLAPDTYFGAKTKDVEYAMYGVLVPDKVDEETKVCKLAEAMVQILEKRSVQTHYESVAIERAKDFEVGSIVTEWLEVIEAI